jgi:hypothetical protein
VLEINLKARVNPHLREEIHAAVLQAVTEVFEQQILPEAKRLSPVGVSPDDKHPGFNRDSIKVQIIDHPETGKVRGWIHTESGYGYFLEHGTAGKAQRALTRTKIAKRKGKTAVNDRTPARPYIYPALLRFARNIPARIAELLSGQK